jgi:hypothetical protein
LQKIVDARAPAGAADTLTAKETGALARMLRFNKIPGLEEYRRPYMGIAGF